jgi:hypothetical protein
MITFHLEANTMEELRSAACSALDLKMPNRPLMPGAFDPAHPDKGDFGFIGQNGPLPGATVTARETDIAIVKEPKKTGRPKKEAEAKVIPEVIPSPAEEPADTEGPGPDDDAAESADPGPGANTPPVPSKELLDLKNKVISTLHKAFSSGKREEVREFLSKNGNGAKSFREIDVVEFPTLAKKAQEAGFTVQ